MSVRPFQRHDQVMAVSAAGPVAAQITVPGSKSLTNRFLLLAALTEGRSSLHAPLHSDDTTYMKQALELLGVTTEQTADIWHVAGHHKWQSPSETIFVGNAGTVMRFLTPALAHGNMRATITGNDRMLLRPIRDLVDGLRQLDVTVTYANKEGYPLNLQGPMHPRQLTIRGDSSSQYLSGLLMVLPLLKGDSSISISGDLVSQTYVEMTLDCMKRFGVDVDVDESFRKFTIQGGQHYTVQKLTIEPDASTASYWFALPLMVGGSVRVHNVPQTSFQGDFGLLDIFESMGAEISRDGDGVVVSAAPLKGVDVDMNTMSDVAPTLAVVATLASSPSVIRNVGNMRIKECDRIATLQTAFDALGLKMKSGPDWMEIHPGAPTQSAKLDPQDDHRMAMVYALLGLAHGGVSILDPECVAKTYPTFYEDMATAFH